MAECCDESHVLHHHDQRARYEMLGYNDKGQTDVPQNIKNVISVSPGKTHTCVLHKT